MFITFEGIDGSGKSTQIDRLESALEEEGLTVAVFREPGGTGLSEKIRSILLDPAMEIDPVTELLLFSAARSQLVSERVMPLLENNEVVILDRFYDSTTAYQGFGRQALPLEEIAHINRAAAHHLVPDLTFYMDLPLEDAERRTRGQRKDRMEQAGEGFYRKVVRGFETLARSEERFVRIDARQPADEIHRQVRSHVLLRLSR